MTQEKEWWEDDKYYCMMDFNGVDAPIAYVPKIVAEATRRAELKAWEEAYQLIKDMSSIIPAKTNIHPIAALEIAMLAIDGRITSLKNL
jgi:hypothetical protein